MVSPGRTRIVGAISWPFQKNAGRLWALNFACSTTFALPPMLTTSGMTLSGAGITGPDGAGAPTTALPAVGGRVVVPPPPEHEPSATVSTVDRQTRNRRMDPLIRKEQRRRKNVQQHAGRVALASLEQRQTHVARDAVADAGRHRSHERGAVGRIPTRDGERPCVERLAHLQETAAGDE